MSASPRHEKPAGAFAHRRCVSSRQRYSRTLNEAFGPYSTLYVRPSRRRVLLDVLKANPDLPVTVGLILASTVVVVLFALGLTGVPA